MNPFQEHARRKKVSKMMPDPSAMHVLGSGGCACKKCPKPKVGKFKKVQTW